jgi:integrase
MHGHMRKRHRKDCPAKRGKRCSCDGPWQARYPDPNGRSNTSKVERSFAHKRDAEAWLISQQSSILQGTHIDPRRGERPFSEVIEAWRELWLDIGPKTRLGYETIIGVHLLPEFGSRKVSTITSELVQAYINRLVAEGVASGTVRNIYAALRNALNTGVRLKVLAINPCQGVRLPRAQHEEQTFLTAEEVKLVAEAIDPHYRVLIWMAAYTGLRAGELHALRRQDVDLKRGVVHVRQSLKDVGGHLHFGPTKTHGTRTVSLPAFLRGMLADHIGIGGNPNALVFTTPTGKPIRHDLFYARHFKPAVRRALPADKHGLRFHDLRHTCASLSIAAGAHPKLISARLGHSSVQITLDRYGHLFPSVEESLAERLDATFAAAERPAESLAEVVEFGR